MEANKSVALNGVATKEIFETQAFQLPDAATRCPEVKPTKAEPRLRAFTDKDPQKIGSFSVTSTGKPVNKKL